MERKIKPFDELTLTDDFMFGKVFETNENLCKELIKLTVGEEIGDFEFVRSQDTIKVSNDSRGVRLDILVKDESGALYNIEMQNANNDDMSKRVRYYQGALDQELLEPGRRYGELPKSIIVLICMFDPFGKKLAKYTFKERCEELPELYLGDETTKIFVCATKSTANEDSPLGRFLDYLLTNRPTDEFTSGLDNAVDVSRQNAEWRKSYMTLERKFAEIREEAIAVGREEGRSAGREEGRMDLARLAIKTNNDAALTLFSKEEIERARASIKD